MARGKKFNNTAARYTLCIHNADTVAMLNELAKLRGNRNEVLNVALDVGVPLVYERTFQDKVRERQAENERQADSPSTASEIEKLRRTIDDLFVELAVQETMLAGLYNAKTMELNGEPPTGQALVDGTLSDLPELVAGIKEDLTMPHPGKGGKNE